MSIINFKTSDDVIIPVDSQILSRYSDTIKNMLEATAMDQGQTIQLPSIKNDILILILTWVTKHNDSDSAMDVSEPGQASVDQQPASNLAVQQPASNLAVQQPASIIPVQQPASNLAVQQPASNLAVQQPASTLAVPGPAPKLGDPNSSPTKADLAIWDSDFIKVDHTTLFRLVSAANYLEVKGLKGLAVKEIASRLKGKTSEEMREILCPPSSSS